MSLYDNGFSKYNVALDYAYAQYSPFAWATVFGGKFKNPLWEPGDLIWDTDINPAGGALKHAGEIAGNPRGSNGASAATIRANGERDLSIAGTQGGEVRIGGCIPSIHAATV